eukprot:TRINITY_DN10567_c0_g1_i1.p1 TRINITY_DN10567_c0_g1~~TRINITY_DN10567_c0_g1_i1.p1  ORF type:complete len:425 (+),score=28.89 TRINITY_DN10567_c0_g1_i1:64-1338(+)
MLAGGGELPATRQWLVVLLASAANLINQADRVVMSIAIVPMSYDLELSPYSQGWILSSFAYGYITTQLLAGPLSEKYGPGFVLSIALVGWCCLTILTPIVANMGLMLLLAVRVFMGVCEGFCWPSAYTWISMNVHKSRRSRSFAILIAAGMAGQLTALTVCPLISWPAMFFLFGSGGFMWVTIYSISPLPRTATQPTTTPYAIYLEMLSFKPVIAILVAHFSHNWGHYICTTWLPTYLHTVLGVPKEELGIVALPLFLSTILSPMYGAFADWLHGSRGVSLLKVRRLLTAIGLFGPAIMFALFPHAKTKFGAISLMCCIAVTSGCLSPGVFSNHADVLPHHAGMAFGLGNTIATIPGLVIGPLTGYLITHGNNWAPLFYTATFLSIIGGLVYISISQVNCIEEKMKHSLVTRAGSPTPGEALND